MYTASVANLTENASSYAAALRFTREALVTVSNNIRNNRNLFRSPKTRASLSAQVAAVKLSKTAGDVRLNVGGLVPVRICKC